MYGSDDAERLGPLGITFDEAVEMAKLLQPFQDL